MNKDDRLHGALLIINELVRISSMEGEVSKIKRFEERLRGTISVYLVENLYRKL